MNKKEDSPAIKQHGKTKMEVVLEENEKLKQQVEDLQVYKDRYDNMLEAAQ